MVLMAAVEIYTSVKLNQLTTIVVNIKVNHGENLHVSMKYIVIYTTSACGNIIQYRHETSR